MKLTNQQKEAIYKLYPQVAKTVDDIAYDFEGNEVQCDLTAINAKAIELEAAEAQAQQTAEAHRQSALDKLTKLGLTADEIAALTGK